MSAGTPGIYERDGRRFVEAGIGTIGWNIYPLYREVDFEGNVIDSFPKPFEWIFPDPVVVAEEQRRAEGERVRLENAANFPVKGMSGEFDNSGGMEVWPTHGHKSDTLGLSVSECSFCAARKTAIFVSDDYRSIYVCRDCLTKMFDAFEAHEVKA